MPASWLVTRPPMPINASVASAVSTANQYSHGLVWIAAFAFIDVWSPATHCAGAALIAKLFDFEGKIHGYIAVLDFHVLRLRAELAVRGFNGVFAGRHILDDELAVLVADAKVRAVKHADPREHPRMHVALETQKHFRLRVCIGQIRGHLFLFL